MLIAPLRSLEPVHRQFRFYCRCINLYSKLAKGRNQSALMQLLQCDEWSFTNLLHLVKEVCQKIHIYNPDS